MSGNRVLIISKSLTSGGAERVAANLATQLNSNQDKAWLLVLDGSIRTYTTEAPIIDIKMPCESNIANKIFWYIKVCQIVKKYKRELGITHSISFLSEPDLLNVLSKKDEKVIVSIRNNINNTDINTLKKLRTRLIFRFADKIVAISQGVKEILMRSYKLEEDRIDVIYNSYNADDFTGIKSVSKNAKNGYEEDFVIMTAGRLSQSKGQWHLIRAFRKVITQVPNVKLLIFGQGEKKDYLNRLIQEMDLMDKVVMMGYMPNIQNYLKRADLFVFPSLSEGFGNILIEAMACQVPIISSDCLVGPRELLSPGSTYEYQVKSDIFEAQFGVLVPVCDGNNYNCNVPLTMEETLMADAIIKLLRDRNIRNDFRKKSVLRIRDFSETVITAKWKDLLKKLESKIS